MAARTKARYRAIQDVIWVDFRPRYRGASTARVERRKYQPNRLSFIAAEVFIACVYLPAYMPDISRFMALALALNPLAPTPNFEFPA